MKQWNFPSTVSWQPDARWGGITHPLVEQLFHQVVRPPRCLRHGRRWPPRSRRLPRDGRLVLRRLAGGQLAASGETADLRRVGVRRWGGGDSDASLQWVGSNVPRHDSLSLPDMAALIQRCFAGRQLAARGSVSDGMDTGKQTSFIITAVTGGVDACTYQYMNINSVHEVSNAEPRLQPMRCPMQSRQTSD